MVGTMALLSAPFDKITQRGAGNVRMDGKDLEENTAKREHLCASSSWSFVCNFWSTVHRRVAGGDPLSLRIIVLKQLGYTKVRV